MSRVSGWWGAFCALFGFRLGRHLVSPDHLRAGFRRRRSDWREKRRCEELLTDFDPEFYRSCYGDLIDLSLSELEGHWLGGGAEEGRVASLAQLEREYPWVDWKAFSANEFLLSNPDILDLSDAGAAVYYARYGARQGRPIRIVEPPPGLIQSVAEQVLEAGLSSESFSSWTSLFEAVEDAVDTGFNASIEEILDESDTRLMVTQLVHAIHHRYPSPSELHLWQTMVLRRGRPFIVLSIVRFLARDDESIRLRTGDAGWTSGIETNNSNIRILGNYADAVTLEDWYRKRSEFVGLRPLSDAKNARAVIVDPPLVSVICSMYAGGAYIRPFLENITNQVGFENHELIIIDAASPDGEAAVIEEFQAQHSNIRYYRQSDRIGIYAAWNIGVELSRGRYLTNANLDDSRNAYSIDEMAALLDEHADVDVVYSDVLYSVEPHVPWNELAHINVKTDLPPLTTWNILEFNSPHCAPMWRRSLHDDQGLFDAEFVSAGDWEFWVRCANAGKRFHKLPEPLIAYYVNPDGISTSRDTQGIREQWAIREKYIDMLLRPELCLDPLRTIVTE
jgi:GT2 family glycosyltransferase